eukprot:symbB.v1.2.014663.t1/scaffold1077.1/size139779/10
MGKAAGGGGIASGSRHFVAHHSMSWTSVSHSHSHGHFAHEADVADMGDEKSYVEKADGDTVIGKDGTALKGWKWDSDLNKFVRTEGSHHIYTTHSESGHHFIHQADVPDMGDEKSYVEKADGETVISKDGTALKGWKWDSDLNKFVRTEGSHHIYTTHSESGHHFIHQADVPDMGDEKSFVEKADGDTVIGKDGTALKGWKWDSDLNKFVRTEGSHHIYTTHSESGHHFIHQDVHLAPHHGSHIHVIHHVEHDSSPDFDCSAGVQNFEAGWSEPKKARDTQSENLELLEASC